MSKITLKLDLDDIVKEMTDPTGVKLTESKGTWGEDGFGLEVTHLIEGPYSDKKVWELVDIVVHPKEWGIKTYSLSVYVDNNKSYTDFHYFPKTEFDIPGQRVVYQLWLTENFEVIPSSGYKITKNITLFQDKKVCSITKEPCFVKIKFKDQDYSSSPGQGKGEYNGPLG